MLGLGEEPVPDDARRLAVDLGDEAGVTGSAPALVEDRQRGMREDELRRQPLLRGIPVDRLVEHHAEEVGVRGLQFADPQHAAV